MPSRTNTDKSTYVNKRAFSPSRWRKSSGTQSPPPVKQKRSMRIANGNKIVHVYAWTHDRTHDTNTEIMTQLCNMHVSKLACIVDFHRTYLGQHRFAGARWTKEQHTFPWPSDSLHMWEPSCSLIGYTLANYWCHFADVKWISQSHGFCKFTLK